MDYIQFGVLVGLLWHHRRVRIAGPSPLGVLPCCNDFIGFVQLGVASGLVVGARLKDGENG